MTGTVTNSPAEAVLHAWIDAVNEADLERLVSLYAGDHRV